MKVWIFRHGEQWEGWSVMGVFRTKRSALKALRAAAVDPERSFPDVTPVWSENGCRFTAGCDYWSIVQVSVQD